MRGPASSLYGPAAGGVIHIATEDVPEDPFAEGRAAFGDYGFQKYQLKAGVRAKSLAIISSLSHFQLDGYRDHSGTRTSILNARLSWEIDDSSDLSVVVNTVASPRAEDPGGLTREQVRRDRRQASPRNLLFDAGEELLPGLVAELAYTFSDFTYDRYQTPAGVFDDNEIPGIPQSQLFAEISYRHPSGFFAHWDALYVDDFFADDANRVRSGAYWLSNLRVGRRFRLGRSAPRERTPDPQVRSQPVGPEAPPQSSENYSPSRMEPEEGFPKATRGHPARTGRMDESGHRSLRRAQG